MIGIIPATVNELMIIKVMGICQITSDIFIKESIGILARYSFVFYFIKLSVGSGWYR